MFKNIGRSFKKFFSRNKGISYEDAVKEAKRQMAVIPKLPQEEEKIAISKRFKLRRSLISKKSKNLRKGYRDNAISRNVQKLSLSERTIRTFGSFAPVRDAWYLKRSSRYKPIKEVA